MAHVLKVGQSWLVRSDSNRVLSVHTSEAKAKAACEPAAKPKKRKKAKKKAKG